VRERDSPGGEALGGSEGSVGSEEDQASGALSVDRMEAGASEEGREEDRGALK